jgi:hypothetical protein
VPPRQPAPNGTYTSRGQSELVPLQVSAASHGPVDARHVVPAVTTPSPGHVVLAPVHVSATSHGPYAARHTVPAAAGPLGTHAGDPVEQSTVPA